ncbi:flotillin domain-containing protein [Escherichia coli]|uniref:flotillin domain-containing protein n=1 Tax=Escherichia coli TaxID=562 RepID=UPI00196A69CA
MFAGKKSAQIREILISESAWEEMTCLFAPSLAEQALSAALSYRTQAPLIDSLLNEIGVSGGSLTALTSPLTSTTPVAENVE